MSRRTASVTARLMSFTGSREEAIALRRAVLNDTGHIGARDPLRDKLEAFVGNIYVSEVSIAAGGAAEAWRLLLLAQWEEIEGNPVFVRPKLN